MSNQLVFFTNFSEGKLDSNVSWFCPPAQFQIDTETNRLVIKTDAKTDFWQRTHYGFEADNGHFLYREVKGDFEIMTKVHTYPVNRYDQAGLMIRVSKDTWIKTSVEYNPDGPNQLGAVVTNQGFSDWSSQNFTQNKSALYFKIQRKNDDYTVCYSSDGDSWTQLRLAYLLNSSKEPVQVGIYACSPQGEGYEAQFDFIKVEKI